VHFTLHPKIGQTKLGVFNNKNGERSEHEQSSNDIFASRLGAVPPDQDASLNTVPPRPFIKEPAIDTHKIFSKQMEKDTSRSPIPKRFLEGSSVITYAHEFVSDDHNEDENEDLTNSSPPTFTRIAVQEVNKPGKEHGRHEQQRGPHSKALVFTRGGANGQSAIFPIVDNLDLQTGSGPAEEDHSLHLPVNKKLQERVLAGFSNEPSSANGGRNRLDQPGFEQERKVSGQVKVRRPPIDVDIDVTRFVPPEVISFDAQDGRFHAEHHHPSLFAANNHHEEDQDQEFRRNSGPGHFRGRQIQHQMNHKQEDVEVPFTGFVENSDKFTRLFFQPEHARQSSVAFSRPEKKKKNRNQGKKKNSKANFSTVSHVRAKRDVVEAQEFSVSSLDGKGDEPVQSKGITYKRPFWSPERPLKLKREVISRKSETQGKDSSKITTGLYLNRRKQLLEKNQR
jgi:hypothetical protein